MKNCPSCKENKRLEHFGKNISHKDGIQSHCKKCRALKEKEKRKNPEYAAKIKRYKQDPKNKRATKDAALKRLFGISIEEYDTMHKNQNGHCAICNSEEVLSHIRVLSVDHCHKTGKIRGLLCTNCNQGIGHFFDKIELLKNAIEYLNTHDRRL